jgi:hypothetical protein
MMTPSNSYNDLHRVLSTYIVDNNGLDRDKVIGIINTKIPTFNDVDTHVCLYTDLLEDHKETGAKNLVTGVRLHDIPIKKMGTGATSLFVYGVDKFPKSVISVRMKESKINVRINRVPVTMIVTRIVNDQTIIAVDTPHSSTQYTLSIIGCRLFDMICIVSYKLITEFSLLVLGYYKLSRGVSSHFIPKNSSILSSLTHETFPRVYNKHKSRIPIVVDPDDVTQQDILLGHVVKYPPINPIMYLKGTKKYPFVGCVNICGTTTVVCMSYKKVVYKK